MNALEKSDFEIWLDFLCWESYFKILFLPCRPKKVFYCQVSGFFAGFLPFLRKFSGSNFEQINGFCMGTEKVEGVSLYELNHLRLIEIIDRWIDDAGTMNKINTLLQNTSHSTVKFKQHLKETVFQHIYRAVEIQMLAEKISKDKDAVFLIRYTPVIQLLRDFFGKKHVYCYSTLFSHRFKILKRPDYNYDSEPWMKRYYCDRFHVLNNFLITWLNVCLGSALNFLIPSKLRVQDKNVGPRIGIELIKTRIRLDDANDIYWLKGLSLDNRSVCGIQLEEFDEQSKILLKDQGIQRYRIIGSPARMIRLIIKGFDPLCKYLTVNRGYFFKTFRAVTGLIVPFFKWDGRGWLAYQAILFSAEAEKWQRIYLKLGIKILWSMHDWDSAKLPKAQALENINGIFAGSHWSIFGEATINQKCYDVLFVWGRYFKEHVFNKYPHLDVFEVGYTADYYFESRRFKAKAVKSRYPDKFVISFYDSNAGYDLAFNKKMLFDLHNLLISFLDKYENLVLFLKPKRDNPLKIFGKEIKALNEYIEKGRVVLFLPDSPRIRVAPAEVALASDLTIGQGISSAAAESYFAGTLSFHADYTGITSNNFCRKGLNIVVFRDEEHLKKAIDEAINGDGPSREECYEIYRALDEFQDGKAYKRTGFVLNKLLEAFQQGLTREGCVRKARNEYDKECCGERY